MTVEQELTEVRAQLKIVALENSRLAIQTRNQDREIERLRIENAELRDLAGKRPRREIVEVNPPWGN